MDSTSAAIVNYAVQSGQQIVRVAVSTAVLKQALEIQQSNAAALLQALPQPALATSGHLGTLVNVYA
jgi:hypothetical protein